METLHKKCYTFWYLYKDLQVSLQHLYNCFTGDKMEKRLVNFRLSVELINKLEELSRQTGKNKTELIEEAIKCLIETHSQTDKQIQLLEEQNKQLMNVLKGFQIALQSKDELLEEKDKRIQELKEIVELLKQNQSQEKKKSFWKFWK
ncbi:ribbon-helix-helix domain-containing protein [Venenivibrio stagnispumantis]